MARADVEVDFDARLVCPSCKGALDWSSRSRPRCSNCRVDFEEHDGVLSLLVGQKDSDWEQAESGLRAFLNDHPEIEHELRTRP